MKNRKLGRDKIAGIACLAVSIFFGLNTRSIRKPLNPGDPGGALFPLIGCVILFICGIAMLIKKEDGDAKPFLVGSQWKRAGILFGIYVLVYVMMWFFGTIITSFITLFVLCMLFSSGSAKQETKTMKIIKSFIYAALATGAIYLIYIVGLKMQLPSGMIFEL